MNTNDLAQRLQQLEDKDAIRQLKARYFACCDGKDFAGFRACFADGVVDIDYGVVGCFDNADALVAIFKQIAGHPHMLEWHHGSNAQIEFSGPDQARGKWSLQYQLINTIDGTLTQIGGEYADEYQRTEAGWKMSATHFVARTTLALKLDADAVKTLMAGAPGN